MGLGNVLCVVGVCFEGKSNQFGVEKNRCGFSRPELINQPIIEHSSTADGKTRKKGRGRQSLRRPTVYDTAASLGSARRVGSGEGGGRRGALRLARQRKRMGAGPFSPSGDPAPDSQKSCCLNKLGLRAVVCLVKKKFNPPRGSKPQAGSQPKASRPARPPLPYKIKIANSRFPVGLPRKHNFQFALWWKKFHPIFPCFNQGRTAVKQTSIIQIYLQ